MPKTTAPQSPLRVHAQPSTRISKSDRTRATILNAALDFLWAHPFRDLSITVLMEQTNVSRSTFYQYFNDLHEVMETLLAMLQDEIFEGIRPWLINTGDPVALMRETITGLYEVCYERGPFLRAVTDAATTDQRLEEAWREFLIGFDKAVADRIRADQEQGLIQDFDPLPVAYVLNRMDAYTLVQAFGRHPRARPEPLREATIQIFTTTLYGKKWTGKKSSNLIRT